MADLNTFFIKKENKVNEAKGTEVAYSRKMKPQNISYKNLQTSVFQYRDIPKEDIEKLADLIEIDGEVLQPLLVRKKGGDTYEILAGHKRHAACKVLVEERGEEKFGLIPCYVKEMTDARAEFAVYSTNGYGTKTDYEIMREVEGMAKLLKENPESFPEAPRGRVVEKLSAIMGISKTTVQEYKTIADNLGEKAMEEFKSGKLSKDAARALATQDVGKQNEAVEKGLTKAKDVKAFIKDLVEKTEEKPVTEQESIEDKELVTEPGVEQKESEVKNPNVVIGECQVRDNTRNDQLSAITYIGKCPHCGGGVAYPLNIRFCGRCGKVVKWKADISV